jgi:O-antigen/teichoic acid export membrane protein
LPVLTQVFLPLNDRFFQSQKTLRSSQTELRNFLEDQSESSIAPTLNIPTPEPLGEVGKDNGVTRRFIRNAAASVGRLLVSALVALVLPAYLTHKLPVKTYSAWVLILQLSAYVSYLDFGVQNGVAKFVAEFEAKGDAEGANRRASAGLAIMLATSVLGVIMTLVLAWQVPHIFYQMPADLFQDVRISLIFVGTSLSFGLFCSVFSAIFLGLQRYGVPMAISIVNRILFATIVCFAVYLHSNLAMMGAAVAVINVSTGVFQIVAWRRWAARIEVRLRGIDYDALRKMLAYCSILAIWSGAMLCISGLDVTIVGRYDFSQAGFYSIATLPTNFIVSILAAALGPFLPSTSALSTHRTPEEMGNLLLRTTRYSSVLLLASGLPLLVGAYPLLRFWVGPNYALHTFGYLRILVLANILRCLCAPYATMVVATSRQRVATASAITESSVNLAASILLARHIGARGVALGTLLGSFASVAMHFGMSMHYTKENFAIRRVSLFVNGILRPAVMAIPSILLVPYWWATGGVAMNYAAWFAWAVSTLGFTWFWAMTTKDRSMLTGVLSNFRP